MTIRLAIPSAPRVSAELPVKHPWWQWLASFNVAVSSNVPVARVHGGDSEGVIMRWGLVRRSDDQKNLHFGPAVIASDSLLGSTELRAAWLNGQRGIVPLAGFYVWQLTASGFRQPYYLYPADGRVFGVAAVWQRCTSSEDDVIESCALVTIPASPQLLELNNTSRQMPLILKREETEVWLRANVASANELMRADRREEMACHSVGPYVNHASYDGPELTQAVSPHSCRILLDRSKE